jgi:hypothetical protein
VSWYVLLEALWRTYAKSIATFAQKQLSWKLKKNSQKPSLFAFFSQTTQTGSTLDAIPMANVSEFS